MKPNMKTKCVARQSSGTRALNISKRKSLLDELRSQKIAIPFSCGGEGICTTCRIILISGELSPQTKLEKARADERGYSPSERLACQCRVVSDSIEIEIP